MPSAATLRLIFAVSLLLEPLTVRAEILPDAPCQLTAVEHSEVSALTTGVLSEVLVDRGTRVSRGQVLARMHSEVEQAQVQSALLRANSEAALRQRRAKLAMLDRTLARNRDLLAKNVISEQDYDQLRTDREIALHDLASVQEALAEARTDLEVARAMIAVKEIRSPIDGVVTERALSAGERAGERPVVVIQRVDRLYAEVVLPVSVRAGIKPGMQVGLSFDLVGLAPRRAVVTLVDPVIDPKTDMFGIRVELDNADLVLPAGLKCRIDPQVAP